MKLGAVLAACLVVAACGGSGTNGDQPFCGDGVVNASLGEQCEMDSDCGSAMRCTASCSCVPERCGDGILDPNEECDHGMANGTASDPCSADCKLAPEVTLHWQITAAKLHQMDQDQTGSCPWWPSGSAAPPAPTSSIRLQSANTTLATFDCDPTQSAGVAKVRLPVGTYSFQLQPVQSSDVFAVDPPQATTNVQGPMDVTLTAQQGAKIQLNLNLDATSCGSLEVETRTNTDANGTPLDLQQVAIDDTVIVQPCTTPVTVGPYPTVSTAMTGTIPEAEYTITITEKDMMGQVIGSDTRSATIPQSNLMHPVVAGP